MLLIIAQDPGKMTGIATWTDAPHLFDIPLGFDSRQFTVTEYFEWIHSAVAAAADYGVDVRFVSESFIITVQTAKNSQAGWSLELIGVMKFLAYQYFRAEITLQTPSVGKTFGSDAKLRHIGWWKGSGNGHANDAARHLMTYAATRKLIFDTEALKELAVV